MTKSHAKRPSLFWSTGNWAVDLVNFSKDTMTPVIRTWTDQSATALSREAGFKVLQEAFQSRVAASLAFSKLSPDEKKLLAVYKRHGGRLSGTLAHIEMLGRGLADKPAIGPYGIINRHDRSKHDYRSSLFKKCILRPIKNLSDYDLRQFRYGHNYDAVETVANPLILELVQPAPAAPWRPLCSMTAPAETVRRYFSDFALDLWSFAQALNALGEWKTVRGGGLAKPLVAKLRKGVPSPTEDDFSLPNREIFLYELLVALGTIHNVSESVKIDLSKLEKLFDETTEDIAIALVKAWLRLEQWQDGFGSLPFWSRRYGYTGSNDTAAIRELIIWCLQPLADGRCEWVKLKEWLREIYELTGPDSRSTYLGAQCKWILPFTFKGDPSKSDDDETRAADGWLRSTGTYCANAVLGTMVHLGLVERGTTIGTTVPSFRLSPLGKCVFGRPDVPPLPEPTEGDNRFFIVQSNYEIQAFVAETSVVESWRLGQFARETSAPGNPVRTFTMNRDSIYKAMESGYGVDRILQYLTVHARTGVPANVARTIEEWGGRREALVFRRDTLLFVGDTPPQGARAIGNGFYLVNDRQALPKNVRIVVHPTIIVPYWSADEDGTIRVEAGADIVAVARLKQFAEGDGDELNITAASISRAKTRGLTVDQIIPCLKRHHRGNVPSLLLLAISNWHDGKSVALEQLLILQVPDKEAAKALQTSERFRPFVVRHISPDWFVLDGTRKKEIEKFLTAIGYDWGPLVR